jgi:hypothetical protein
MKEIASLGAIAGAAAAFGGWLLFLIQVSRLPWHIRWDFNPHPSPFKMQFALWHPEWLDAKGLAIRRSARRFLVVAVVGFIVVACLVIVGIYVDV